MIEILPWVLNMDCKCPKLAFWSEIPLFYSFERWYKYSRLGNRWKMNTLVVQFYGCFALRVFEPVTWLKTINWRMLLMGTKGFLIPIHLHSIISHTMNGVHQLFDYLYSSTYLITSGKPVRKHVEHNGCSICIDVKFVKINENIIFHLQN